MYCYYLENERDIANVLELKSQSDNNHCGYLIQMRAWNDFVPGNWSSPINISVLPPSIVTSTGITNDTITADVIDKNVIISKIIYFTSSCNPKGI